MKGRISKTIYLTGQFWLIEVCNPDYETGVRFSVTVSLLFLTTTFHNPNVLRFFFFFVVVLFSLTEALPILYCAMSRSPAGTSSSLIFFQNNFVFFFLFLAHFFPPSPIIQTRDMFIFQTGFSASVVIWQKGILKKNEWLWFHAKVQKRLPQLGTFSFSFCLSALSHGKIHDFVFFFFFWPYLLLWLRA